MLVLEKALKSLARTRGCGATHSSSAMLWFTPHMSTLSTGFGAWNTFCFWLMTVTFLSLHLAAAVAIVDFALKRNIVQRAGRVNTGRAAMADSIDIWFVPR